MSATAESLNALADRVEREEPSRELDWEIRYQALGIIGVGSYAEQPAYTTSLDAAVTLVPEGCGWVLNNPVDLGGRPSAGLSGFAFDAFASTPAAALTAAAIRARAALLTDGTVGTTTKGQDPQSSPEQKGSE